MSIIDKLLGRGDGVEQRTLSYADASITIERVDGETWTVVDQQLGYVGKHRDSLDLQQWAENCKKEWEDVSEVRLK